MAESIDQIIDAFLVERRARNSNVEITRREIVDFLLQKNIGSATPSEQLAEIARYLKRGRERGVLARIGVGKYIVGDISNVQEYAPERVVAFAQDDSYAEIIELRRAIDLLKSQVASDAKSEFLSVGSMAKSSQFFVTDLSEVDLEPLRARSF